MVDMEDEKRGKKVVLRLTGKNMRRSCSSSSSPTPTAAASDSNRNKSENGDFIAEIRQKKEKDTKTIKWRTNNSDMFGSGKAEISDGDCHATVLSSLTKASFRSLIRRKRVRILGKVAEDCDAVDPPVPRKLRSAINKRAGRAVSTSPRHVKKRRHLSAISAQIFAMDRERKFNQGSLSNSFTKEEEDIADALISLSQTPAVCEAEAGRAIAEDCSNIIVASTSYSEETIKKDEKITALPSAGSEVVTQPACTNQPQERTGNILHVNHGPGACATHNSINPPLLKDGQRPELSFRISRNLPRPSEDSSTNITQKQLNMQFDGSLISPADTNSPRWLATSKKPDVVVHDERKDQNSCAKASIQNELPSTSYGYSVMPSSSKSAVRSNATTETFKSSAADGVKTWKKSIIHVKVCHFIQKNLNEEKASQHQVKLEESPQNRISRPPNGSILNKNNAQDERLYAMNFDPRLPASGIRNTATSHPNMVNGNFQNMPTCASTSRAQHVLYYHPQMTPSCGPMPYQFPHNLPYSRGTLAPGAASDQQMAQYMRNPGYAHRPGLGSNPAPFMKLQQLVPTPQQQQQMWQFHFPQYQPRPDAWQNGRLQDMSSSRQMPVLPPQAIPPHMELLCAPHQGGSARRPLQLRMI